MNLYKDLYDCFIVNVNYTLYYIPCYDYYIFN